MASTKTSMEYALLSACMVSFSTLLASIHALVASATMVLAVASNLQTTSAQLVFSCKVENVSTLALLATLVILRQESARLALQIANFVNHLAIA